MEGFSFWFGQFTATIAAWGIINLVCYRSGWAFGWYKRDKHLEKIEE